jgi:hypothetical protein
MLIELVSGAHHQIVPIDMGIWFGVGNKSMKFNLDTRNFAEYNKTVGVKASFSKFEDI